MKQNRALIFLFLLSLVFVGFILVQSGHLAQTPEVKPVEVASPSQESMGDPIPTQEKALTNPAGTDEKKSFFEALKGLAECFQVKSALPDSTVVGSESLLSYLQTAWGPYQASDLWMNWQFKNKDGAERRLRLEVSEDDAGIRGRDLHLFAMDAEGSPVPLDLGSVPAHNPSDDVISDLLKEGEVISKEKSAMAVFAQGETLQYSEKNGSLDAIEIHQNEKTFHCENLKQGKDPCVCN